MTLLDSLIAEADKFLDPILGVVSNPAAINRLLGEIGTNAQDAGGDTLVNALSAIVTLATDLDKLSSETSPSLADIAAALVATQKMVQAIEALEASSAKTALEGFGRDLLNLLIVAYLGHWHQVTREVATLLTLIEPAETQQEPAASVGGDGAVRNPFVMDRVHFERLPALIRDPLGTLRAYYWNDLQTKADADAIAGKLFVRIRNLLRELKVPCRYGINPGDAPLFGDETELVDHALVIYSESELGGAEVDAGITVTLSPADHGDLGLVISPFGTIAEQVQAGLWEIDFQLGADVQAFAIGRNGPTLLMSSATTELNAKITATLASPSDTPAFVLGSPAGSRLEVGGALLSAQTTLSEAQQTLSLSAAVSKSALVLAAGDGDGFLQSILPANGVRAEFDLGLAWSSTGGGLKITGAGGLDVTIPVGISAGGIVSVDSMHLGLQASETGILAECSASAGLSLGPVNIVIDRMGLLLNLTFPDQGANLGVLNADLGFKPPSGLGIAIDAGVVTGGGFLSFDPANSQYSGAASLSIEGIGVSAFGLVQTQPEVNFLLLIATTFPVPIELGMGFLLEGVGGLAGINRSLALDALETAVWKGTAKDILFPSKPIASADSILNELNALFPPAGGRYLFGPTLEIVWGEPALIVAQVGVIIELPDPVRIALIGNATAQFPPEKPLVLLKVNFAGGLDFGASRFFFDASLTGSRIESYPLTGDLSVRSTWAEPKNFALAVGGFNPHFQPPAGFPTLTRVSLDISDGPLHLHLAAYLAITTNTFQVGASVDLKASVCDCGVAGHFAFDALFTKNPFSFGVALDASASITAAGETFASVHVQGTLSGPAPWHATGSASISLLFFSIGVSFDRTWGSPPATILPAVDPWTGALLPALADPASWRVQMPAGVHAAVTFAPDAGGGVIYLDPAGDLVLDQKAVPLNQPIERFAESTLATPLQFDVAGPAVNGTAVDAANWTLVSNEFAPSQFMAMSDDEKLSAESFVALPSGIVIDAGATTGGSVQAGLTYDLIVIDSTRAPLPRIPFLPLLASQLASASTGPPARAPWRRAGLGAFAPAPGAAPKAALASRVFSIVSTANLAAQAQAVAATRFEAGLALAGFVQQHGAAPASLQAVPQWESA